MPPQADCSALECGVDGRGLRDVAIADHDAAYLLGERLDAFLQRIALVGESKLGAVRAARLGDAPRERTLVCNPHDQAALSAHEA